MRNDRAYCRAGGAVATFIDSAVTATNCTMTSNSVANS